MKECPWCGSPNVSCDMTDIGVGMQQTGPCGCEDCHAYQLAPNEPPASAFEKRTGWHRGENPE